ncbi:hypothetical protein, variant [Verruconis gallopava]|nr:hypothetical protein, variant [Verruconis gallopava]KIW03475.1 hypothetical protein, variant [Verruconis gallopava]
MGGIVAAETVLSIKQDQPISSSGLLDNSPNKFMFPYVQGIVAFDTPYLGIAPGVVAHGAEGHWKAATTAYNTYNSVASAFGWGGQAAGETQAAANSSKMFQSAGALPANADAAAVPAWQKYGRYAMFAGAAGALVAGSAAAYMKRDAITGGISEGWGWASSHLEFVGCLARGEELTKRLKSIIALEEEQGFGFANLYTTLGRAVEGKSQWASSVVGSERTFCTIPKSDAKKYFFPQVNDKATAETWAHMNMFTPRDNPGYYSMSEQAKELIVRWACNSPWYEQVDHNSAAAAVFDEEPEIVEKPADEEFDPNEFEQARRHPGQGNGLSMDENPWA